MNRRPLMTQLAQVSAAGVMLMVAVVGTPSCTTSSEGEPAQSGKESSDGGKTADATGAGCTGAQAGLGCLASQEGTRCSSDCSDPCSWCGVLTCEKGVWNSLGIGPAAECGDDAGTPCSNAHEGDVCSKENETCGSCTDPCQFCNLLRCSGGRWTGIEAFPTPPSDPQCQKDGGQTDGGTTDGGDDSGAEDSGS